MAKHRYRMSRKHREAIARGVRRAKRRRSHGGTRSTYSRRRTRSRHRGGGGGYVRCSICHRGFIGGTKGLATHKRRRHRGSKHSKRGRGKHGSGGERKRKYHRGGTKGLATHKRRRHRGSKRSGKHGSGGKRKYHRFDVWAAIGQEESRRQQMAREAERRAARAARLMKLGERRRALRALSQVDWDVIAKAEAARRAAGGP